MAIIGLDSNVSEIEIRIINKNKIEIVILPISCLKKMVNNIIHPLLQGTGNPFATMA